MKKMKKIDLYKLIKCILYFDNKRNVVFKSNFDDLCDLCDLSL
jgi:hypothetical protein